jgi:urease subunit alpha
VSKITRKQYADLYGPTTGDKIRLGDTSLYVEIEKDLRVYGDELITGGGKTLRDGMGSDNQLTQESGCLDLVITNVTILDPELGVIKADVGIRNGRIVGVGKAGNPSTMNGVTPGLVTGTSTDAITGEHLILTPAGMDTHVHYISPQQVTAALSNGITTFWGGGIGPSDGTNGVTSTNGPWNVEMMLRAAEGLPINIGFQGKGNSSGKRPLVEQLYAGAAGFKIHEDYGTTVSCIRACLSVAEEHDVSVSIHTDTLNEVGYVEDTIAAFNGRTIHTYHSEGAGGGHAPDLLKVVGQPNVLPSSTNPTLPCGVNC